MNNKHKLRKPLFYILFFVIYDLYNQTRGVIGVTKV